MTVLAYSAVVGISAAWYVGPRSRIAQELLPEISQMISLEDLPWPARGYLFLWRMDRYESYVCFPGSPAGPKSTQGSARAGELRCFEHKLWQDMTRWQPAEVCSLPNLKSLSVSQNLLKRLPKAGWERNWLLYNSWRWSHRLRKCQDVEVLLVFSKSTLDCRRWPLWRGWRIWTLAGHLDPLWAGICHTHAVKEAMRLSAWMKTKDQICKNAAFGLKFRLRVVVVRWQLHWRDSSGAGAVPLSCTCTKWKINHHIPSSIDISWPVAAQHCHPCQPRVLLCSLGSVLLWRQVQRATNAVFAPQQLHHPSWQHGAGPWVFTLSRIVFKFCAECVTQVDVPKEHGELAGVGPGVV